MNNLQEACQTLLDHLRESHQDEIANNHFGDGDDCSYCRDMAAAARLLDEQEPGPVKGKVVTLDVEFVVELFDATQNPDEVTFDLYGRPMAGEKIAGRILRYTTQQYVGENPE